MGLLLGIRSGSLLIICLSIVLAAGAGAVPIRPEAATPPPALALASGLQMAQLPNATVGLTSTVAPAEISIFDEYATLVTTVDTRGLPTCPPVVGERQPLDIVLIIDRSGSMDGPNISAARAAAQVFVQQIDTAQDQVGIVVFDDTAQELLPLSRDQSVLAATIGQIQTQGGTDIGLGITAGQQSVEGTGANATARRILVLLSDGGSDEAAAVAAASRAKGSGIRILTIGLGGSNNSLLQKVASSPSDFIAALDPAKLSTIYTSIAQNIQQGTVARDVTVTQSLPTWSLANLDRDALASNATVNQMGNTIVWSYPVLGPESLPLTVRFRGQLPGTPDANAGVAVRYRDCNNTLQSIQLAPGAPIRIKFRFIWWCLLPLLIPLLLLLLLLRRRTRRQIRREGERIPEVTGLPAFTKSLPAAPPAVAALDQGAAPVVGRQPALILGLGVAGASVIAQMNEVIDL